MLPSSIPALPVQQYPDLAVPVTHSALCGLVYRPSDGAPRASELFPEHIPQHRLIQAQICNQLFQPALLFLKLLHLPGLIGLRANLLLLPSIEGLLAESPPPQTLPALPASARPQSAPPEKRFFMQNLLRFCRRLTFDLVRLYRGLSREKTLLAENLSQHERKSRSLSSAP
jgi:hypothetical protein